MAKVEHLHDVAVIEPHRHMRFVDEHVAELGIRDERRQDALEHDRPFEAFHAVLGAEEDLGHAAVGDLASDAIAAGLRHRRVSYRSNRLFA